MKNLLLSFIGFVSLATTVFASNNAEVIFDNKCAICHIKGMPTNRAALVAPPLMGVMRHVKMQYASKEAAVNFMVDYVQYPSKKKAVCMPQKISRFGLMPSQKENISVEELKQVTVWMYDNFPSNNFRPQGMRKMQSRPTFEMFDINGDGKITKAEFNTFQNSRMNRQMSTQQN